MGSDFFMHFHIELWISGFTFIITTIIAWIMKRTANHVKEVLNDIEYSKESSKSILHDRLYQGFNFYLRIGAITSNDMENMGIMYKAYSNLGGNGTCKILHDKVADLPIATETEFEAMVSEKGGRANV
jgi:hypothetical protein